MIRYQIDNNSDAWKDAEKAVLSAARQGKSKPVVSIKSSKEKRKAGQATAEEVYKDAFGDGDKKHKKHKKSRN